MKVFKRLQSMFLMVAMLVCNLPTAAFAAEADPAEDDEWQVVEFSVDEDGNIETPDVPRSLVDQTFYFTHTHRGADRTYYQNSLQFYVTITAADGSCPGDTVSIQLKDYYNNTQFFTAYADGATYFFNTSITYGRTYYFYYKNVSSSTRQLKVHMVIN